MAEPADDPHSQSALGSEASAEEDSQATGSVSSSAAGEAADNDDTVLTTQPTIETEDFPQGLSPRELAVTLKGQLLDHFHLQEFIGGGGMGAVFKALDTTLDRIVAVKVVASQSISSEELQRRFLVEAQSTARLDHPNIARIHFVGRDRGLPYIVFEYIEGVNLRDMVLHHGPIPLGDALSFTVQIAHALAHAWRKEVVHRDIKPSNILITHAGQAKLVDMGLARVQQVDTISEDLTGTGVTLGTFDYISPEQARDPRDADTRSDIYSLGCTLFYMLAGRPPFFEGTAVQKLLQHQDQMPPYLSELRPEIPESVSDLVVRMLAKPPELRPQTPSELVHDCHQVFRELGLQLPSSLPALPKIRRGTTISPWRTNLPWMIPLLALLAISAFWVAIEPESGDGMGFPPLRSAPVDRASDEEPSPPTVVSESSDQAVESPPLSPSGTRSDDRSSFVIEPNIEVQNPSHGAFDAPSLLEFSTSEPASEVEAAGQEGESFDFESLFGDE